MRYFISLFVFICLFGSFSIANSQGFDLGGEINVELVPSIPKAGESVYVFLTSYSTNIDLANITWKINGKVMKSGVGEKIFNFSMGGSGQTTTLGITVKTQGGGEIVKTFSLKPISVDLVWESDGFIPPFYKGKSLFSHQNKVTVVAIPHIPNSNGLEINPKNLIYKWRKNGSVIDNVSGYGKNSYTFEGSLISRPVTIGVEVSSISDGIGYANITLDPVEPGIIIYKKDPVYGIEFQNALKDNTEYKNSSEISIIGMPYFYDFSDYDSETLVYKWLINGTPLYNENNSKTQTFRQREGTTGTSRISLSIENPNKILQYASKNFNLTFTNNVQ